MKRAALVVMACLLVAACSTLKPQRAPMSPALEALWQQRQALLGAVDRWDIKGRMAVRTADDGGSATFIWERDRDDHRIEMFGPFGSGRVTITQSNEGAILRDGDDPTVSARSAEELLYYRIGWHVPFESLKFWLKGIPSTSPLEDLVLDEAGRAVSFQQDGWKVSVLDYTPGEPAAMPRRVFLEALPGTVHLVGEDGEDLGDRLDVRVVLRRWQVLPG